MSKSLENNTLLVAKHEFAGLPSAI